MCGRADFHSKRIAVRGTAWRAGRRSGHPDWLGLNLRITSAPFTTELSSPHPTPPPTPGIRRLAFLPRQMFPEMASLASAGSQQAPGAVA